MSTIVFAGAAQFAAVGYVVERSGLARGHPADRAAQCPPPALLGGPRARGSATSRAPRRALMAHLLTDEAFALSIAHFERIGRADERGYWIAADRLHVHPVEPGDPGRGDHRRRRSRTRPGFGLDVVFPAAMVGLAVGLVTGRRELVAALGGAGHRRRRQPARGARARGHRRAAWSDRCSAWPSRAATGEGAAALGTPESAERYSMPGSASPHGARDDGRPSERRRTRPPTRQRGGPAVSIELVGLAVLMGLVTYPSRALPLLAPGIERLPGDRPRVPAAGRPGGPGGAGRGQRDGRDRPERGTGLPRRHRVGRRRRLRRGDAPGGATCSSASSAAVALVAVARATGIAALPL